MTGALPQADLRRLRGIPGILARYRPVQDCLSRATCSGVPPITAQSPAAAIAEPPVAIGDGLVVELAGQLPGGGLWLSLEDGRIIGMPIVWSPRLSEASDSERQHYEIIGRGTGLHWPDLDEYVSVRSILLGRRSAEGKGDRS